MNMDELLLFLEAEQGVSHIPWACMQAAVVCYPYSSGDQWNLLIILMALPHAKQCTVGYWFSSSICLSVCLSVCLL